MAQRRKRKRKAKRSSGSSSCMTACKKACRSSKGARTAKRKSGSRTWFCGGASRGRIDCGAKRRPGFFVPVRAATREEARRKYDAAGR